MLFIQLTAFFFTFVMTFFLNSICVLFVVYQPLLTLASNLLLPVSAKSSLFEFAFAQLVTFHPRIFLIKYFIIGVSSCSSSRISTEDQPPVYLLPGPRVPQISQLRPLVGTIQHCFSFCFISAPKF